jgi:hypothetical protein
VPLPAPVFVRAAEWTCLNGEVASDGSERERDEEDRDQSQQHGATEDRRSGRALPFIRNALEPSKAAGVWLRSPSRAGARMRPNCRHRHDGAGERDPRCDEEPPTRSPR